MKRLHVHIAVDDLDRSIGFYAALFGTDPTVLKDDYAKWMLDDPKVNFAISARGRAGGVDHLGIQVDSRDELDDLSARLRSAGEMTLDQEATTCCYAKSDKAWVHDPSGIKWETFFTFADAVAYGEEEPGVTIDTTASACCAPATDAPTKSSCCG